MDEFKQPERKPVVALITLGCAKNTVDSEIMLGQFVKHGCEVTLDPTQSDVIIINTCGFVEDAKKESIDVILSAIELKKEKDVKIFLTGCMVQRYYKMMWKEFPEVDGFLGTENFNRIIEYVIDPQRDPHEWEPQGLQSYLYDHTTPRVLSTPDYMSYVKIAEGCSHKCSFCAIPGIRGTFRSRQPESVIQEVCDHAESGVKEVILIAQDTSYYGRDLDPRPSLPDLLTSLDKIDGLEWIRMLYLYPDEVDDQLLETMAGLDRVANYIDIPFQHVNPRILKAMNRNHKIDLMGLVKKIRSIFNNEVAIRTTFLVGFPGETDAEFDEIIDFLEEAKLDRVTAFPYSDEDGTAAFDLEDKLDTEVGRLRFERIMDFQRDISFFINETFIGKTLKVVAEGKDTLEGRPVMIGRSYRDVPEVDGTVIFHGEAEIGEFVDVEITDAQDYDLVGELV